MAGFGQSGSFTYTPDIAVYVQTSVPQKGSTNQQLDLSADVLDAQMQLLIDQPSTFNVNLNNSGKKWDGQINRLDPIVVFLKRTSWVQVMAGYVTVVPILTRLPTPVTISAQCSLLKLQDTWWDIGSLAAQSLLPTLLGMLNNNNIFSDQAIADSILQMLTQVSNWPVNAIHIQGIPSAFLNYAAKAFNTTLGDSGASNASVLAAYLDAQGMYAGLTPSKRFTSQGVTYDTQPAGLTPNFNANNGSLPLMPVGPALTTSSPLTFVSPPDLTSALTFGTYKGEENEYVMTGPFGWQSSVAALKGTAEWIDSKIVVFSKDLKHSAVLSPLGTNPSPSDQTFHLPPTVMTWLGNPTGLISMAYVDPSTNLGEYDLTANQYNQIASAQNSALSPNPSADPTNPKGPGAVQAAISQLGVPYSYGGGDGGQGVAYGRSYGTTGDSVDPQATTTIGFDCEGLTRYAWHTQGIDLPAGAINQYNYNNKMNQIPPNVTLQAGDLVFFGSVGTAPPVTGSSLSTIVANAAAATTNLSLAQLLAILEQAGFTWTEGDSSSSACQAAGVIYNQTNSYNVSAVNYNNNPAGSTFDRGLFQINTSNSGYTNDQCFSALGNCQAGWILSAHGTDWSDWNDSINGDIATLASTTTPSLGTLDPTVIIQPSSANAVHVVNGQVVGGGSQFLPSNWFALLTGAAPVGGGTFSSNAYTDTRSYTVDHVGIVYAPPGLAFNIDSIVVGQSSEIGATQNTSNDIGIMIDAPETGEVVRYDNFSLTTGVGAGLTYVGAMRPTGVIGLASTNNTLAGSTGTGASSTSAVPGFAPSGFDSFSDVYQAPQFNSAAQTLYGTADGFMADDTLLDTLLQVCGSTMRHIQSAPNGDFIAFFADYFGLWGQTPVMRVEDIEITDFRLYANDANITTHVALAGDTQGVGQGISLADWLTTTGIVSLQTPEIMQMLFGPSFKTSDFNAAAFLNRYGIRPYVSEVPTILDPVLEFMFALLIFMQKWADQYESNISTTFMPEIYPGMIVQFPGVTDPQNPTAPLQAYVTSVVHTISRSAGFTTEMTVTCPSWGGGNLLELALPTHYTKNPQAST